MAWSTLRLLVVTTLAVPVLLVASSCSLVTTSRRDHPSPASSAASAPTSVPTSPSPPGAASSGAPAVPPPKGLAQVGQGLVFAGSLQGTVSRAEVKQCGLYGRRWSLQMSNMALDGGVSLSMVLYVDLYTEPGSYAPSGS